MVAQVARQAQERRRVVVVTPALEAKGGISRVNALYERIGLFGTHADGLEVRLHPSAIDGGIAAKTLFSAWQLLRFAFMPLPRPAIVHLHASWHASFWRKTAYAWLSWLKGAQVLLHVHPTYFMDFYEGSGPARQRAIRATIRRCQALMVLTGEMAEKLGALAPGCRMYVMPNPVDLEEFGAQPVPAREPATVLFLGWFVPGKGAYDLLDALARLQGHRPGLRAVFGGYKLEDRLRERVRALGLSGTVEVAGWCGRADVVRLLRTCTLFALPTYSEGIPMAVLEAMACGTPVVTCPVGGIPAVARDGRNALFVRPGDVDGLTAALERLLDDPALREAMSQANREDIRRYDVRAMGASLLGIYRELAGIRRGPDTAAPGDGPGTATTR
jgi:glycosyltransferase involved in cell wall biosynthesis